MVNFTFLSVAACLAANTLFANAQENVVADENVPTQEQQQQQGHPPLNITASTTFPDADFGVKIVNGHILNAGITIINHESDPISLNLVAGQLFSLETGESVRNLTLAKYQAEIAAGNEHVITYPIQTEMHPADLRLMLTAFVSKADRDAEAIGADAVYTLPAFNGVVSVVEPETSIFDPQILFLYFFLGSLFCGTLYFFYTVWIVPYLPAKQRKPASAKPKPADKPDSAAATGADAAAGGAASPAGGASYNTEWIPAHHIARPEAKKVKGTARKSRS